MRATTTRGRKIDLKPGAFDTPRRGEEAHDARQEYELSFNDKRQTVFPYDLISAWCQYELDTCDRKGLGEHLTV